MTTRVSINGTILEPQDAHVSVFDRGFLYGDSVFEVLRTYAGVPFALEEHLGRLQHSATLVAMQLPVPVSQLRAELDATLRAAGNPESYARIIVTRGSGEVGLDTALARDPLRVILVQPLAPQSAELYVRGVKVALVRTQRATDATAAAGAKSSNYLANLLALRTAKQSGAHEAIVVRADGEVLEGATSNIFAFDGRQLRTPPIESGILGGITRAHAIMAARSAGIPVVETRLAENELMTADEVFITSTLREIVPVVAIDEHEVGSGTPGDVTRKIHRAFRKLTPIAAQPMPWEHSA